MLSRLFADTAQALTEVTAAHREAEEVAEEQGRERAEIAEMSAALTGALERLIGGDLSVRLDMQGADRHAGLKAQFNAFAGSLGAMIQDITTQGDRLLRSSEALAQSACAGADRAQDQAATLDRSSRALVRMTAGVEADDEAARMRRTRGCRKTARWPRRAAPSCRARSRRWRGSRTVRPRSAGFPR
ncbi:MAG: methyl-accepting chemotaxis protein [Ilumatobacteraceae bacterium]